MAFRPKEEHDIRCSGFHSGPCKFEALSVLDPAVVASGASVGSGTYPSAIILDATGSDAPGESHNSTGIGIKNPILGAPYTPTAPITAADFVSVTISKDQGELIKYLSIRYRSLAQEIETYLSPSANRSAALRQLLESKFTVVHAISQTPEAKL